MVALTFLGVFLGLRTQRHLRDRWKLVLFGYDDGHDEDREPLADQDGALFLVFVITCLTYFFGLKVYNGALAAAGAEKHKAGSGMHTWTYAFFNLVLAGLFTFVSDTWNMVTVVDQMAQAIHQKQGVGYEAYGAAERPGKIARFSAWFVKRRLLLTRAALVVFWGIGVPMMVADYVHVEKVLSGDTKINESVGKSRFWSAEANDEFARHFVGCCVAALNILIVMQDWDFPDFSGGEIKISALDIESLKFEHCCAWVRRLVPPIYVSGKWVNYMGILMGLAFDWGYWFMTSLPFRPCDYAQFGDSDSGSIYTLTQPKKLQEEHAGAAAALNCAWFTDSPVQQLYDRPYATVNASSYDDDAWTRTSPTPHVVLVETGSFTGAYTIDEEDNYVYVARGAWLMWLMVDTSLMASPPTDDSLDLEMRMPRVPLNRRGRWDDGLPKREPRARANVLARLDKVNAPVPPLRELIRRPRASLPNFDTRIGNAGRRLDQADRRAREASEEKWYVERATERELKRAGDADPYAPAKAKRSRPLRPLLRVPKKIRSCPPTPTSSRRLLPSLPPGAYPEQTKMADMLTVREPTKMAEKIAFRASFDRRCRRPPAAGARAGVCCGVRIRRRVPCRVATTH
ncbi:hypothetical protein JL720_15893 [Aureococcus anophagefferens]|nr:hypothetical protein JL720_15893 [Aureococcus anophagefferens]